jgi:hypothetical protein
VRSARHGRDVQYVVALDKATGKTVWKTKHSASAIYGTGRICFFSERGTTTVLQPGRVFQSLATNQLEGRLLATPAVADDAFLVRTRTHLYRLEDRRRSRRGGSAAYFAKYAAGGLVSSAEGTP